MMPCTRPSRRDSLPDTEGLGAAGSPRQAAATRRVVLELPRQDPEGFERLTDLGVIESFRVIHLFRFDSRAYAGICRVKFRDPAVRPTQMVGYVGISKVGHLAQLADVAYLANIEGRPTADWTRLAALTDGAMYPALELTSESWRITVVGSTDQIKGFLANLRELKMRFKVLSVEDADFQGTTLGPANAILTPKQREALLVAYQCGYYDIPKRAESADVAKALALGKSTTLEHLRKAEKRLLDSYMQTGGGVGRA